ncbi:hemagglutinin repeat-containing protein [Herbaspirillum seropedicae]|uniref:hemagglutinin repeat-containing protein n=1 Tax=Herbaspirillum seropedicae TaxID=964 RepID=UPI003D988AA7
MAAKQISILAAAETERSTQDMVFKQSGLTIQITSPVLSAIQTAQQMAQAAKSTSGGRMQLLAAANIGFAGKNAVDAVRTGQGFAVDGKDNPQVRTNALDENGDLKLGADKKPETRDATAADKAGGINLAISVGASKSENHSQSSASTARGSTLNAGGNINLTAQGGGADSNLIVQGSDIRSGANTLLKADNEVRLLAARSTTEQSSSNRAMSGSVGISIGTDGFLVNAGLSGSRGRGDGSDVAQVNTHVDAGNKLTIASGTDTTIKGAVASGKQVVIDVGTSGSGNLNIESLQDTSTYKSRQQSAGVSISAGMGRMSGSLNLARSSVDGNYASVNEQSGVKAGDDGFQINVAGNTDLKGAKIASTDKAAADGKNSLTTETLTQSDIKNRSDFKAESQSVGMGTSLAGSVLGLAGSALGMGNVSGSDSSTTRSGISQADIKITDDAAQQAKTGKTAEQTIASINGDVSSERDTSGKIAKTWNGQALQADVEARAQITQAFGQQAVKMVGSYAGAKEKELRQAASTAAQNGDQTQADQLNADADQWKEGGAYRAGAHAAIGLLAGGVSGALGAGASSALMPDVAEQIKKLGLPPAVESAVSLAAAAGIGAAVGGGAGAASAYNVDLNNRQLHKEEPAALNRLSKEKNQAEQRRLIDAACALTHCSAGVPDNDPMKAVLTASEQRGQNYMLEQSQLKSEGLFTYGSIDRFVDMLTRYQVSNRSVGAVQGLTSTLGGGLIVGSSCATVAACALGVSAGGIAFDYGYAGFKQLVTGDITSTYGEQVLQSFGLSPTMAALLYNSINIGTMAGAAWPNQISKATDVKIEVPQNSVPIKGPGGGASLADDNVFNLAERELVPSTTGSLTGKFEVAPTNAPVDQIRSIQRQNEAAETLSKSGLQVENLANTGRPGANPDLKINGNVADVYAPTTGNPKSIRDKIVEKVNTQAPTVVVNLADSPLTASDVAQYIQRNPVSNMKSLFIMKSGKVYFLEVK